MNPDQDTTKEKVKWYYRPWMVIFILLNVGPLGLPLLYKSPKFSKTSKYIITAVTLFITYLIVSSCVEAYHLFKNPEELKITLEKYLNEEQMRMVNMYITGDIGF